MKLIDNWQRGLRLWSVQLAAVMALLNALQQEVLPLVGFAVPPDALPWINAALGVAIIVLRLLAQPDVLSSTAGPGEP